MSIHSRRTGRAALFALPALALGFCGVIPAHADLSYTMTVKTTPAPDQGNGARPGGPGGAGGPGGQAGRENRGPRVMPTISTIYSFKGDEQRVENLITSPMFSSKTITIADGPADKIYTVDPSLNIYMVAPMGASRPNLFGAGGNMFGGGFGGGRRGGRGGGERGQGGGPGGPGGPGGDQGGRRGGGPGGPGGPGGDQGGRGPGGGFGDRTPENGTLTTSVTVVDKGKDTINGAAAHHWLVITSESGTGTVRANRRSVNTDIWTSDIPQPMSESLKAALDNPAAPAAATGVTYNFTGDVGKLKSILTDVPVQIQTVSPRGDTVTITRTSLSKAPISAAEFAPPTGAKELSEADYRDQQRQAMMKRFQGMGGNRGDRGGRRGGNNGAGGAPPPVNQ